MSNNNILSTSILNMSVIKVISHCGPFSSARDYLKLTRIPKLKRSVSNSLVFFCELLFNASLSKLQLTLKQCHRDFSELNLHII